MALSERLAALVVRVKKMAGALGRTPTEGEVVASFKKKGETLRIDTARKLVEEVRKSREAKDKPVAATSAPEAAPAPVAAAPVEPKPEARPEVRNRPWPWHRDAGLNIPTPAPKQTTRYGRR
jgi:hypothetical protein